MSVKNKKYVNMTDFCYFLKNLTKIVNSPFSEEIFAIWTKLANVVSSMMKSFFSCLVDDLLKGHFILLKIGVIDASEEKTFRCR